MALRSWAQFEWVRRLPYFRCGAPHTEASAHPHGWQFAVEGTILETPGEPAYSTLKDRLYHGAYPTQKYGRIVFDDMDLPDRQPPFPVHDSFVRPGYRFMPGQKYFHPGNWPQIMENAMDAAHAGFGAAAKTSMTGSNGRRPLPIASNGAGRHHRPAIPLAEIVCRDHFTESGCPGCVIDLCQDIQQPFRRVVRT